MASRIFDVERLTRPMRLRCRPHLVAGPSCLWLASYSSASKPALKEAVRLRRPDAPTASVNNRAELSDYDEAVKIASQVSPTPSFQRRAALGPLPSLSRYMPPPGSIPPAVTQVTEEEAGMSSAEAGPSSAPPPTPSLKGKERAIAPELETASTASPSAPVKAKRKKRAPTRLLDNVVASSLPTSSQPARAEAASSGLRRNPVGVQLLAPQMHQQIFPGEPLPKPPQTLVDISRQHLAEHGLSPEGAAVLPEIAFDMPALEGGNIREHYRALGKYAAEPYLSMAREFAQAELPPVPKAWETTRPGWTRYGHDGSVTQVDNLNGETLVCFDVETLWKLSPYPVMATAASPNAWYSWLSPCIFEDRPAEEPAPRPPWEKKAPESHLPRTLIPLFEGNTVPTIAVGHNVGYDRARVKEEYALDRTPTRWLDTLSLHVATRGITSVQRPAWMKHRKNKIDKATRESETMAALREEAEGGDELLAASLADIGDSLGDDSDTSAVKRWEDMTSANSLADVAALHCGIPVDKSIRDRFSDDEFRHASQLRPELTELLNYCATDVKTTHAVYKAVLPLFLNSCPHPATFAGVLAMGSSFLPVDDSWNEYLRSAETMYQEMRENVRCALRHLADRLKERGPDENDPWTSQLDWTSKPARWPDSGPEATISEPVQPPEALPTADGLPSLPAWYAPIAASSDNVVSPQYQRAILPLLLRISFQGYPVYNLANHMWCFRAPIEAIPELVEEYGAPVELSDVDAHLEPLLETGAFFRVSKAGASRKLKLVGKGVSKDVKSGVLTSPYPELLAKAVKGDWAGAQDDLVKCAEDMRKDGQTNEWASQLDWTPVSPSSAISVGKAKSSKSSSKRKQYGTWPKWYWDLTVAETNKKISFGELDLTMRKSVAPLLLRMQWNGYPLALSKEYKWLYRVPKADLSKDADAPLTQEKAVLFLSKDSDLMFREDNEHVYFRIPHKDGEGYNVGNPLSKAFLKAMEKGELSSALADDPDPQVASAASAATNMNALCSYWISSRERIMKQFVVYRDDTHGMILPQVITMGTVTRRAVEATWLTASNAKKNRVGSELKAMVRAPPGYALVGADVDSQELWISSVMGDSQFGVHGATAIGWMTLEGTKSAGTDLHSKTASILGTSRDAAKVFNYSRIYGAGKPHAIQLLLQGDGSLTHDAADKLATDLYKKTKGAKSFRSKGRGPAQTQYLWHGGSESYLFNTLEAIALMDRPTTPALGCGVTRALRKSFLDVAQSYLPSRINWVVQSSGVDYLHLLITSMEYLVRRYDIKARYLISVHDEVRYLASEEDKYRTALALQIANAWTRALFCFNLGLDDMPQGVAFFSAVDIDTILRKEPDMPCVTPSHTTPLAPGETLDINTLLARTPALLGPDAATYAPLPREEDPGAPVAIFDDLASYSHQSFLRAQKDTRPRAARAWLDAQPQLIPDGVEHESDALPKRTTRKAAKKTPPKRKTQPATAAPDIIEAAPEPPLEDEYFGHHAPTRAQEEDDNDIARFPRHLRVQDGWRDDEIDDAFAAVRRERVYARAPKVWM